MKILVINPNSSEAMTAQIRRELEQIKRPDTTLVVERVKDAPPAIESRQDAAQAVHGVLEWVRWANREGFQTAIIACFSDPGLEAAREVGQLLVLGIQETTLHVAAMLGHKFTILTTLPHRIASKEWEVRRIGLEGALASVRALDLSVADMEADPKRTKEQVLRKGKEAVEEDGAEVLVLGCAGMVGCAQEVNRKLGVVVLDPTSVTLKVAEGLVEAGVRQSNARLYRRPRR